ncbi:MAG: carcinine hydrolase/isopenicillin-N N-acyltransferase family protein [Dysgonomonas sp.]
MKRLSIIIFLVFIVQVSMLACTTAIISGKYTIDGRPLLYKHRDTGSLQNKLMAFADGKYDYIGIVNSSDKEGKEVWGGYNSAGFAIMNSASYNLNPDEEGKPELEGVVMKLALQQCATVDDFQRLLDSLPKPLYVSANFGVIDAKGGGAYFETGDYKYVKFDVNNAEYAPEGFIIRTNYSFVGDDERRRGISRYVQASDLFHRASDINMLSNKFLSNEVSRCLKHGTTGLNFENFMPENSKEEMLMPFRDFIPRYSTASVIVVQGVKENESPEFTTMWTTLGSPLSCVAIPVWLNKNNYYPSILLADATGNAPLCEWSLELKKQIFPMNDIEGRDYIDLAVVINKSNDAITQKITRIENEIFKRFDKEIAEWRKGKFDSRKAKRFCDWVDKFVTTEYHKTFNTLNK